MPVHEGAHVRRPRVESLLDGALTRRVTLVVAPVGAGKSEVLRGWVADVGGILVPLTDQERDLDLLAQRLVERLSLTIPNLPADLLTVVTSHVGAQRDSQSRAATLAGLICDAIGDAFRRDFTIVIDDVDVIADSRGSLELLNQLILQASHRIHFVLAGQRTPDLPLDRLWEQRQVQSIGGVDLALDREEAALWLSNVAGPEAEARVDEVLDVTSGWPVAVHAVAERLRVGGDIPSGATDLANHAREAIELLPEEDRNLLRRITPLPGVCVDLCAALGIDDAAVRLARLARAGLFLRPHALRHEWYALTALARAAIGDISADEACDVNRAAARWLFRSWQPDEGLACLVAAGAHEEAAEFLQAVGDVMVTHGHVEVVLSALDHQPPAAWVDRLTGIALHAVGQWDEGVERMERAAGGRERIDPALAWRIGLTHHQRGELDAAARAYARSDPSLGSLGDHAMAVSWSATVDWLRGDRDACARAADDALALAIEAADTRALASAHTVLALVASMDGDWRTNDAHYRRALEYAERAADVMQRIRIQTNRGSLHLERGDYEAALACVDAATRLDDLGGFAPFGALALVNRAEIAVAMGRLEEAQADLESAIVRYEDMGSRMVGYALGQLGHLHLLRGDRSAARRAFEEVIEQQRHDVQGLVPALTGLALTVVADDPDRAIELIAHALDIAGAHGAAEAQIGAAVVAMSTGFMEQARLHAWAALLITEERGERAGRADALVLASLLAEDAEDGRRVAHEAIRLADALGSPLARARAGLALAKHSEPDTARDLVKGIREHMRAIGCRLIEHDADTILAELDAAEAPPVVIEVLGRSRVILGGRALPSSAWQSRKARTLLKLLVARRGRIVARDELSGQLWPDDDPARTGNRLSVALSTLRSVLDPHRAYPTNHFIVTTDDGIGLDLEHVRVDAFELLEDVEAGEQAVRAGRQGEAVERFARASRRFVGEAFDDDPYSDWTIDLREQVRAANLLALRHLADAALAREDRDDAVRHLLRVLEQDAHDESAHLHLVRLFAQDGRHGEARRRYRLYVERMRDLGVHPAPFPAVHAGEAVGRG